MKKNGSRLKLALIKERTLKLRSGYQLPYKLSVLIYKLTGHEDAKYVRLLMSLTEHYLRVVGYYKRYKDADKQAGEDIQKVLSENGF